MDFPSSSALILVAVVPSLRDIEIARLLGWYRMPLRSAPKIIEVDYLAFYQTGAFGEEHRWKIETFAEVKGHELTTRIELIHDEPDHPRAYEEYYKIQLGSLQRLSRPIHADKWRRITFFYTTGALFQKAEMVNDLIVRDSERQYLWKSLRERALSGGRYNAQELSQFEMDAGLMSMIGLLNHSFEGMTDETK